VDYRSSCSGLSLVLSSYISGTGSSGYLNDKEFLDLLSNCKVCGMTLLRVRIPKLRVIVRKREGVERNEKRREENSRVKKNRRNKTEIVEKRRREEVLLGHFVAVSVGYCKRERTTLFLRHS
jgi:hypothetical protein